MRNHRDQAARIGTSLALAVVCGLAATLAASVGAAAAAAVAAPVPPAATVPPPRPCDLAKLEIPCWACPEAQEWPLRFRTDLDMLAPLGTGTANAATWFAALSRPDGARLAEAEAALARRTEVGDAGLVLPPDDPLLLEAEPWCDQATMRFYPDVYPVQGFQTRIPHLLLAISLARSWIARGQAATSFDAAMADFRRVVRLGRLFRQDDVASTPDLIGLACIRIGAQAIYDRARAEGHTDLALLAAVVAGEAAPQRLLFAARTAAIDMLPYGHKASDGSWTLDLPETRFAAIRSAATSAPDRRFRLEAAAYLRVVVAAGPQAMRAQARATLEQLQRSDDPIVASDARWCLEHPPGERDLKSLSGPGK